MESAPCEDRRWPCNSLFQVAGACGPAPTPQDLHILPAATNQERGDAAAVRLHKRASAPFFFPKMNRLSLFLFFFFAIKGPPITVLFNIDNTHLNLFRGDSLVTAVMEHVDAETLSRRGGTAGGGAAEELRVPAGPGTTAWP
ncbi:unnamed protein product [Pleuronectes platessa]|uniref:Uncharacterized protein n=1 Tax=Pleuronectes platessa TaxID=8262 RepID=A0A9N7UH04_PLEPL|nr:unnamed protein product [Pleuronectes platessa]